MHVLIVATKDQDIEALAAHLNAHGVATEVESDEACGLSAFEASQHEIVLIDSRLPVTGMARLVENIRRIHADTRIVFLASSERMSVLSQAFQLGISWFALRPFDKDDLLKQIQRETLPRPNRENA